MGNSYNAHQVHSDESITFSSKTLQHRNRCKVATLATRQNLKTNSLE